MATELRRWSTRYGVAFKPNSHAFMSNTLRLMHGAVAAQMNGWSLLYQPAIYRAIWAEAQNLCDDTVLRKILEKVGVPTTELMADIERHEVKDRLRRNTDRAVERGVFGAPTFLVGDEMFWGNDRFVEEAGPAQSRVNRSELIKDAIPKESKKSEGGRSRHDRSSLLADAQWLENHHHARGVRSPLHHQARQYRPRGPTIRNFSQDFA
jgi:predicted DsbA family dithiol-disulfide isomerase